MTTTAKQEDQGEAETQTLMEMIRTLMSGSSSARGTSAITCMALLRQTCAHAETSQRSKSG